MLTVQNAMATAEIQTLKHLHTHTHTHTGTVRHLPALAHCCLLNGTSDIHTKQLPIV